MRIRNFLLLFSLLLPFVLHAQERKKIPYSQLALDIFDGGNNELEYRNTSFYNDLPEEGREYFLTDSWRPAKTHFIRGGFKDFLRRKGVKPGPDGKFVIRKAVRFENCSFSDDIRFSNCRFSSQLVLKNVRFPRESEDGVGIDPNKGGSFQVDSCHIEAMVFDNPDNEQLLFPRFRASEFGFFQLVLGNAYARISRCQFNPGLFWMQSHHKESVFLIDSCIFSGQKAATEVGSLTELYVKQVSFSFNHFRVPGKMPISIDCPAENVQIYGNRFDAPVNLILSSDFVVKDPQIRVIANHFSDKLSLGLESIGSSSEIYPDDIKKLNFGIGWDGYYDAANKSQLANKQAYRKFQKTNKLLFDFYRNSGDLESANRMYVRIMDAEGRKLRYDFENNRGFQTWFRHKLNRLLNFYTRYGTDPARALVLSVYVLLVFAFLYFFFPSDWDIDSKARLISKFRDFVEKNEKGYLKPFFYLIYGITISMFNAFFLSLNAFTTLGFGDIPTRGFARYLCIFQGFIGWFLLSIFTVALFNQAQF